MHIPDETDAVRLLTKQLEAEKAKIDEIVDRVSVFHRYEPEEDETWESWYDAAFGMLLQEVMNIKRTGRPSGAA